ncbi:hypothetical protein ACHAWT_003266 [Skeletonema menzelii]
MNSFAAGMQDLMMNEMEKEKGKLQSTIAELEERLARVGTEKPSSSSSSYSSWESTYTQFDRLNLDTREELEEQIHLARSKLIRLNEKKQSNHKSCPHSHPCLCCSQNRSAEIEVMTMTTSQRIEKMKQFQLDGNALFKNNKSNEALGKYEKALIYYEYCFDAGENERTELEHVRLLCLLNAAACTLDLKSYAQSIEFCNEALEIDDANPKALYRRGKAHRLLNQYVLAKKDLERAVELKGGKKCKDLRREMMLLQQCEDQYKQARLEFAQKAIGGSRKADNEKN